MMDAVFSLYVSTFKKMNSSILVIKVAWSAFPSPAVGPGQWGITENKMLSVTLGTSHNFSSFLCPPAPTLVLWVRLKELAQPTASLWLWTQATKTTSPLHGAP